jgi:murein DD-endopeptidase MepM/ murein hydrolase activator NlpD
MLKGLGFNSIFSTQAINLAKGLSLLILFLVGLAGCLPGNKVGQKTGGEGGTPAHPSIEIGNAVTPEMGFFRDVDSPAPATVTASGEAGSTPTPVYFTPTLISAVTPELVPNFHFCSPLENHNLSDLLEIISFPYDPPPVGKDTGHHGVDFAYYRRGERLSILGVPIQSVLPGRVVTVNQNLVPYGYMVIVETLYEQLPDHVSEHLGIPASQSLYLLYAHMNEPPSVEEGTQVECGQGLGYVGNTPENWSSAPHLHFEARYGPPGGQFSGMQYYDKRSQIEQMEKYTLWRMSGSYVLLDPVALLTYGLGLGHSIEN